MRRLAELCSVRGGPEGTYSARVGAGFLLGALLILAACYWVVARSCDYDHVAVLKYTAYVVFSVWLPGLVVLRAIQRHPVSPLESIALGLPLGFTVEILTFLGASVAHARGWLPVVPAVWIALSVVQWWKLRREDKAVAWLGHGTPSVLFGLAILALGVVLTIAAQFYAGAPLRGGELSTATHHDWAYLLSRAAEIKQHWPLGDPSLAGAPLTYHYFLLVHVASASLVTGVSLDLVTFRLFVLPLGAALIAQTFLLGKNTSGSLRGGLLAAVLVLAADELSFVASTDHSTFGNLFVRWLFISPTFFFGMIFSGALVLWIHQLLSGGRPRWTSWIALAAVAAVGTGAKGTVVPPLLAALALWLAIDALRNRRIFRPAAGALAALAAGFAAVYLSTLSAWGTGAAQFSPLASIGIAEFWTQHLAPWTDALLAHGLPWGISRILAMAGCVAIIAVGFCGVRLLALAYVWRWRSQRNPTLTLWLGIVALAHLLFGQLLSLDSQSQLYLFFPIQLPLGVLGAAAIISLLTHFVQRARATSSQPGLQARRLALALCATGALIGYATGALAAWQSIVFSAAAAFFLAPQRGARVGASWTEFARFSLRAAPVVLVALLAALQVNHWRLRSLQGLQAWRVQPARAVSQDWALLLEGMDWIRNQTPREAVIMANAFTMRNASGARIACIDDTTVDKYYYYSALAERRLWVEGPTYLLNQPEARHRMEQASQVFYGGLPPSELAAGESQPPEYVLIDRSVGDHADPDLPQRSLVFENARLSLYRMEAQAGGMPEGVSTAELAP